MAAPGPPAVVPDEIAHGQTAIRVAIDGVPEEHRLALPFLGNEVGMGQVEVEQVGVEDRLAFKLLAKLVADDHSAVLLLLFQVENDFGWSELELPALDVLLDFPVGG